MKAVQWHAPRDMRVAEMSAPEPGLNQALVRVESTGICGSDLHYYLEGRIGASRITPPLVLGHEYAGIVTGVGEGADPSLVGKRVAVEPGIPCMACEWCVTGHYNVCPGMAFPGGPPHDGAFCEYMAVPAAFCFPVPEAMSSAEAAMMEPLAVALHTVELAGMRPGDTAAVLGLGPIGLLTTQVARLAGADTLYGTDLHDYRVDAGRRYGIDVAFNAGAEDTVDRILAETRGRGVDIVFDCARSSETLGLACKIARPGGTCILTGISGEEDDPLPVSHARRKGLTLRWCRRFRFNYPRAIALTRAGRLDVASLITHSFPLERTQEAFEIVAGTCDGVLKASIDQ